MADHITGHYSDHAHPRVHPDGLNATLNEFAARIVDLHNIHRLSNWWTNKEQMNNLIRDYNNTLYDTFMSTDYVEVINNRLDEMSATATVALIISLVAVLLVILNTVFICCCVYSKSSIHSRGNVVGTNGKKDTYFDTKRPSATPSSIASGSDGSSCSFCSIHTQSYGTQHQILEKWREAEENMTKLAKVLNGTCYELVEAYTRVKMDYVDEIIGARNTHGGYYNSAIERLSRLDAALRSANRETIIRGAMERTDRNHAEESSTVAADTDHEERGFQRRINEVYKQLATAMACVNDIDKGLSRGKKGKKPAPRPDQDPEEENSQSKQEIERLNERVKDLETKLAEQEEGLNKEGQDVVEEKDSISKT